MVSFDGIQKQIAVSGVTDVDIQSDIYSAWKRWVQSGNTKYLQAMRPSGGDSIGGGQTSPAFFFLMNDWKVYVDGEYIRFKNNLFCEEDSNLTTDPFIIVNNGGVSNDIAKVPVVIQSTGSGLSTEEHNKLFALDTEAVDIAKVNGTVVSGVGSAVDPWGPA